MSTRVAMCNQLTKSSPRSRSRWVGGCHASLLENLESRLLLSTTYHAGDLDPSFNSTAATLPWASTTGGYYMADLTGDATTNYTLNMTDGFWGFPNVVRTAYESKVGSMNAPGYIVAKAFTDLVTMQAHVSVTRYTLAGADQIPTIDTTFNASGATPGTLTIDLGSYGLNNGNGRSETLGGVTVDAAGNISSAGCAR